MYVIYCMKRIVTIALLSFLTVVFAWQLRAQQSYSITGKDICREQQLSLTTYDSILALKIPELTLPEQYKGRMGRDLPAVINNAELPFLRPVFSQENYANCGQSAGVAYNFTYEMDRARDVPANIEADQYTPQFAWNFMNGGSGWYGVSYFHSFEILKKAGTPSVEDYGGMYKGGEERWMSGYEAYRSSMLNRIDEVYYIDVGTIEGINTLKYWLYDHLEDHDHGGVASFYSYSAWNYTFLPEDSPEAGKHVITKWYAPATHALTIVGYNDSIRFDYNNDGKFTNDIDINDDGVVDLKDWEIGGFLFVNSYGDHWADSGFCYAMYNAFGYTYQEGGIWNQSVNVLKVKPDYQPLLGLKLKLKHNSRNKLKIIAGVSADTALSFARHTIDFPIVNFQGGNKVLQGSDTLPDADELELELDITPLLTYVSPDAWARYFVQIIERDKKKEGEGQILFFSIVDYTHDDEITCSDIPTNINDNSITSLSVIGQLQFNKVRIVTDELPVVEPGTPYSVQLHAEGGDIPYKWSVLKEYKLLNTVEEFPEAEGEEIEFSNSDSAFVRFDLPFPFPFYGDTMNRITVHIDGFITFEKNDLPYPYFMGESAMLQNNKMIAPFLCDLELNSDIEHKVSYESADDYFLVKWQATSVYSSDVTTLVFALKIFPSGDFVTYFEDMDVPDGVLWSSGVSVGDGINYLINHIEIPAFGLPEKSFRYMPLTVKAENLSVSSDGLLEVSGLDDTHIYQVRVAATDNRNISAIKEFQLSSGLIVSYEISSGNDDVIGFGETAAIKAIVKNISASVINDILLDYSAENDYVTIIQTDEEVGALAPGETKIIDSSFVIKIAVDAPDRHTFRMTNSITSENTSWQSDSWLVINAPNLVVADVVSEGNTWIEPGLTRQVDFRIANAGHAVADDVEVQIIFESDSIELVGSDSQIIDYLPPNNDIIIDYQLKVSPWVTPGTKIPCWLTFSREGSVISVDTIDLQIGRTPVLLVDLDPNHLSSWKFRDDLETTNTDYVSVSWIPDHLTQYKSVFVLLGSMFANHELTYSEGRALSDYLDEGGNLYMEGRVTWKQEQTPVHSKFDVDISEDFVIFLIDTVYKPLNDTTGQKGFEYLSDRPYNDYYLIPRDSAFNVLLFRKSDSACVVANETDNYKTIVSVIEYGALADTDSSFTTVDYLNFIIDFFGLKENSVGVDELAAVRGNTGNIKAYPNPFKRNVTIQVSLPNAASPTLQVFNQFGKLVYIKKIDKNSVKNNELILNWDGSDLNGCALPTGIYFIRLISGKESYSTKIVRF